MRFRLQSLARTIRKLVRWFPVIVRDEDWSDTYFYDILISKLMTMEEYASSNEWDDENSHIDALRRALRLATRVRDDPYMGELLQSSGFLERWGEPSYEYENDGSFSTLNTTYANAKSPQDNERADNEYRALLLESLRIMEEERKLLFETLFKYLPYWWD